MSAQSYGNASYSELQIVKAFHLIPHLNSDYSQSSKQFDIDTSDINNEYAESVIVLPITITVALFIALCIFELALCFRVCCKCCTCMDDGPARNSMGSVARWTANIAHSRDNLSIFCALFGLLTAVCCSGVVWAAFFVMDGNDNSIDATHSLQQTTGSLETSGDNLEYYGYVVYNLSTLAIPSCPQAEVVQESTVTYLNYVEEYNDLIGPIPHELNTLEDFLKKWGEDTAESVIWNSYGIYLLLLVIMSIAFACKSKTTARVALGLGLVIEHLTLVLFCIMMIVLVSALCVSFARLCVHHVMCMSLCTQCMCTSQCMWRVKTLT